jgi:hypothetical protein
MIKLFSKHNQMNIKKKKYLGKNNPMMEWRVMYVWKIIKIISIKVEVWIGKRKINRISIYLKIHEKKKKNKNKKKKKNKNKKNNGNKIPSSVKIVCS